MRNGKKYIITESQFEKFLDYIFSFNKKAYNSLVPGFFLVKDDKVVSQIVPKKYTSDIDHYNIYIPTRSFDTISDMLSITFEEAKKLIENWFHNKFNIKYIILHLDSYLDQITLDDTKGWKFENV